MQPLTKVLRDRPEIERLVQERVARGGVEAGDMRLVLGAVAYVHEKLIPGDIIEMGCCTGDTSIAIRRALVALGSEKTFHVCDSFAGLPAPTEKDGSAEFGYTQGMLRTSVDVLLKNFSDADESPPVVHKGWFSEIDDYPAEIAMAFLDGDLYSSIMDGLVILYPRMASGGTICIHDYGYPPLPGVPRACDDFFRNRPENVCPYAASAIIFKV